MLRRAPIIAMLLLPVAVAEAGVTRIEVTRREPFASGQAFGTTGAYEKVVGRFFGDLDPAHPLNAGIVDLDRAPRNARGRVEYSADFYILKPVDGTRGNGALIYDVNNRGNKIILEQLNSAGRRHNDPSTADHAGNGFLMRHGFTIAWSGWIPGLPAASDNLRIDVPSTMKIEGTVWDEFAFNTKGETQAALSFRAVSTDTTRATLTVREGVAAATVLGPGQWEFANDQTIRLLPSGTAFRPGAAYELTYRAANPPVSGIGFAATRDFVAFLRRQASDESGTPSPLALGGTPFVRRALAHGTSQSGRYLRDFIHRGFNEDEAGRIVFDGVNPHVSAGRIFLSQRFAQPNRGARGSYPDSNFPFAYETQTDSLTGKTDGMLARCAARRTCPKIMETLSSNEYWGSGQSLVTTDSTGRRDTTAPDSVRIYHIAGTQHVARATMPAGVCTLPPNPVDLRPVLRTLVLALDRWVADGTTPPPSRHPRIADGTLVTMEAFAFPRVPGFVVPVGPSSKPRFDYGTDFEKGILGRVPPVILPDGYGVLLPKVDADGNELGGIRLPDIAVPMGTATGWAVRSADAGAAGTLCGLDGSFVPFAKTKSEREATGDPRPSLQERYRDKAEYLAKVRQSTAVLEREGYLLTEDVQRIHERAAAAAW